MPFGFDLLTSNRIVSVFSNKEISDRLKDNVSRLGERLKIGGSEVGQKLSAGMSSVSLKVMELFQGRNHADSLVEEATVDGPDWATNLEICDVINHGSVSSLELIQGIKKRIVLWKIPGAQYLSLLLLDTVVKNCESAFSDVAAAGRMLDEMVKLIDDPRTAVNSRDKALMMIESWGDSSNKLRYSPVYEQTYKSLKSRGIRFPCRDNDSLAPISTPPRSVKALGSNATLAQGFSPEQAEEALDVARNSVELLSTVLSSSPWQEALQDELSTTLLQQCRESQYTVHSIIETTVNSETLLFEALNVNDEIQNVVSKYEDMKRSLVVPEKPERAIIPVDVELEDLPRVGKEEEEEDALIRKRAKEFMERIKKIALMKWISVRNLLACPKQQMIRRKNSYSKMIVLLSE